MNRESEYKATPQLLLEPARGLKPARTHKHYMPIMLPLGIQTDIAHFSIMWPGSPNIAYSHIKGTLNNNNVTPQLLVSIPIHANLKITSIAKSRSSICHSFIQPLTVANHFTFQIHLI